MTKAERKESVNNEAVINTDNVQNETRKRKISENICSNEDENEDTEMNGQHNECEILPSCNHYLYFSVFIVVYFVFI
jgi:hypothetical protein